MYGVVNPQSTSNKLETESNYNQSDMHQQMVMQPLNVTNKVVVNQAIDGLRELQQQQSQPQVEMDSGVQVEGSAMTHSQQSDHSGKVDSAKQLAVYQEVQSEPQEYNTAKNQEARDQLFEKERDAYSTPSHTDRSKGSRKRVVKAFEKSESRLKRQIAKEQGMPRQVPESRGTAPRFGMERQPYSYGMGMQ